MKARLIAILSLLLPTLAFAQVSVGSLKVNRLSDPLGISPDKSPTLSWVLSSKNRNTIQTAYEVEVASGGKTVWSSGRVESDNSAFVKYEGPLSPDTRYNWSVRVWDNHGKVSKKATGFWSTGLRPDDWRAKWVGKVGNNTPIKLRGSLKASRPVRRATAYVSAHGFYEASLNGKSLGEDLLTPGWTSYEKRLQYQAYDVTSLLKSGLNEVHATLAPGWYSSGMGWGDPSKRYRYGDEIFLLFQINVEYTDGTREQLCSDETWEMSPCEVTFASIYDGETIDHTVQDSWSEVEAYLLPCDALIPTVNEPVRRRMTLKPVAVITTPKGEKVIDFGQNIVGWEKVRLRGAPGDTVIVRHAEVLDENGNFYTVNLREAKTTSTYVLEGGSEELFEPTFTFYGFRYISVEGLSGELNPDDFEAVAISSGFEDIGHFACSNETINQLQHNIEWSFHDNFVDIPTDCPQRDERLGWTGDAQVFFRTASFLGNVGNFFDKWLADLSADQREDGRIPRVIPDIFQSSNSRTDATGWADCCTIIPWNHYMAYGDVSVLENQYPCMKAWVDLCISRTRDNDWLLRQGDHYGDWLFWSKNNDRDGQSAVTSKDLIAQCFFANSLRIVVESARVLGRTADVSYYEGVLSKVRKAYMDEYVTPNGLISSNTQTAYVLALKFHMIPSVMNDRASERLVANISSYKDHMTTGFLGTPYICEVLTDNGHSDVAYKLLLQKTCPSWIYPISLGATTIWERWDSMRKDGSIPDNGMNSFNHYSFGAIGDWLYRSAVGIRETSPGYKTILIRPHTGGGFEWMEASTITPYGKVSAKWTAFNDDLTSLDVEIPVNTNAEVILPAFSSRVISCDDKTVKGSQIPGGLISFKLGSGSYRFTVAQP